MLQSPPSQEHIHCRIADLEVFGVSLNVQCHSLLKPRYVWIDSDYWDGQSFDLCCKTLTLPDVPLHLDDIPIWTYSGDATWQRNSSVFNFLKRQTFEHFEMFLRKLLQKPTQSFGQDAKDVVIVPRRTYRDPFRPGENVIVLADTYEDCQWLSQAARIITDYQGCSGCRMSSNCAQLRDRSLQVIRQIMANRQSLTRVQLVNVCFSSSKGVSGSQLGMA